MGTIAEGMQALREAQKLMREATTKAEVLRIMADAGAKAGYAPAFRCLVLAKPDTDWYKLRRNNLQGD
jgi:hypothetical protein